MRRRYFGQLDRFRLESAGSVCGCLESCSFAVEGGQCLNPDCSRVLRFTVVGYSVGQVGHVPQWVPVGSVCGDPCTNFGREPLTSAMTFPSLRGPLLHAKV